MNYSELQKRRITGAIGGFLGMALLFALAGWATPKPRLQSDTLNFLADGKTSKAEVITALGEPSGRFENGTVLTYRLTGDHYVLPRQTTASGWPTWRGNH